MTDATSRAQVQAQAIQDEVIAFLADPATHGLAGGTVAHVRTHISEVFLAGSRAYKIKRPVAYAFVDFTTIGSRHAACEAEVRLNRRTAPEIYLGTVAIRRAPRGGLALDALGAPGPGTPVEWAVVMARFDERDTLDHVAERGELPADRIDALTDAVVALHGAAEVHGAPWGGAAGLGRIVDENATDMARFPAVFAPARANALTAATGAALARHTPHLDRRRDDGFVRRCHGDLHLGNIVLWQGTPVPFDCIEFSDDIAIIDVAYDLAFLLMDLEVRGLRPLANRVLARYVGRTGDTGVLPALPLMLALRALVRAKVTAMALDTHADAPGNAPLRHRAETLITAAEAFLAPPAAPRLIAVGGLSGTGKTTLAAALAPAIGRAPGALLVRSDVIRKRLASVAPESRLPASAYSEDANRRVYDTLRREAAAALAAGQCAVVDAVFARPEERAAMEEVARGAGAGFTGLWLEAPAEALTARVTARRRDASDADAAVVVRQLGTTTGEISWHRLDAGGPPEAIAGRATDILDADAGTAR